MGTWNQNADKNEWPWQQEVSSVLVVIDAFILQRWHHLLGYESGFFEAEKYLR